MAFTLEPGRPTLRCARRLVLALGAASLACASVVPLGNQIDVAEESAFIVWDEAAKIQHFIRRASFRTAAKDFGFLVPTPSVPELKEVSDLAFPLLDRMTRVERAPLAIPNRSSTPAPPAAAPVVVLAQASVAGYDAAVLEASDAKALGAWLKRNGYASSPQLIEWVRPYLERQWKITAFKISRNPKSKDQVDSAAVRMSFKTDEPYFPYREPATSGRSQSRQEPRLLRVYLLATSRMEGGLSAPTAWPGRLVWSDRINEADRAALLGHVKLPDSTAPGALWLTKFEDASSPRPGVSDLVFRRVP